MILWEALSVRYKLFSLQTKNPVYRQILKKVFSFFFLVAPGKPTDLRVASVRDLKIMLKWKRPLTTAGAPDSSVLSYMVSYQVVGSGPGRRVPATSESAELDLQDNKQYNIYVKAVRPNQSTWSDVFGLHTNTLGEFGLVFSPSKESFLKAAISMDKTLWLFCGRETDLHGPTSDFRVYQTRRQCVKWKHCQLWNARGNRDSVCSKGLTIILFEAWWRGESWAIFWGMKFFSHL